MSFNSSVHEHSMSIAVWYDFQVTKHRFIDLTRNQRHRQRQLPVVQLLVDEATVAPAPESKVLVKINLNGFSIQGSVKLADKIKAVLSPTTTQGISFVGLAALHHHSRIGN
ncbi:uncharacterized protein N7473_004472 [Penicillium subrubescens]|uniref:uncharacterized protein n=1 Tax=Penicillium subrubescens TaxID=1316194 RepID=UPI0025452C90|nr:uncharacterized protein N7473_004472 [Penicillium subrubescens]KAJ5900402.1 hypothetical protein N7473_004472 [Penicillium subrubescens]